jgi:putative flippase GtrA
LVVTRFLAVGAACALLHNVIMIGGDWAGLHYVVSSVVSYAVVVVFGYCLHSGWTYSGTQRGGVSFLRYALMASGNLPLGIAIMYLLVDVAGIAVPLASPIATLLLFLFNFAGTRWALRARRA